uniref:tRNA pseudouridine synthase n=1 Tax=Panagrellus redivivus TaxID=6233 RepID=A0A7E4VAJ7_PANRE
MATLPDPLGSVLCENEPKNATKTKSRLKKNGEFDFSRFPRRRIAILFLYLGWDYEGLVMQDHTTNTVEQAILDAMIKTRMIESKDTAQWSRCGRTDKGVSGFRQVGSVTVRSTDVDGVGVFWPDDAPADEQRVKSTNEMKFDTILNNVLPSNIRVIAWAPAKREFNARFECTSRSYMYLFPRGRLNITAMQLALDALVGSHDFRNFCRIDMNENRLEASYVREIFNARLTPVDPVAESSPYQMIQLQIKGSGFLWHQIRCIVTLVHEIGLGNEEPSLITKLLDVQSTPAKPQYAMARDMPLCFFDASYTDGIFDWKSSVNADTIRRLYVHLQQQWCEFATKAAIVRSMMTELKSFDDQMSTDVCDGLEQHIRGAPSKTHIPILKRPTCDSLETKIAKFTKKRRVEEHVQLDK